MLDLIWWTLVTIAGCYLLWLYLFKHPTGPEGGG